MSGPPGTGKSALLTEVLSEAREGVKRAYVNCMTMKDPKGIYSKLSEEFLQEDMFSPSSEMADLEKLFIGKKNSDNLL